MWQRMLLLSEICQLRQQLHLGITRETLGGSTQHHTVQLHTLEDIVNRGRVQEIYSDRVLVGSTGASQTPQFAWGPPEHCQGNYWWLTALKTTVWFHPAFRRLGLALDPAL